MFVLFLSSFGFLLFPSFSFSFFIGMKTFLSTCKCKWFSHLYNSKLPIENQAVTSPVRSEITCPQSPVPPMKKETNQISKSKKKRKHPVNRSYTQSVWCQNILYCENYFNKKNTTPFSEAISALHFEFIP
ncbi:hypothetical protein PanWU01x14_334780 [Parasponia andersonii]|uniref:Uncharacterized protein n=1 Tax=Parasponia andersonii TaxID=3476 RepID=A0A2P5AGH1_PARAD|nr:hypothetical protein PanWU01x14_334780 [Parasponia andersonii]